jgi:uncharacterized protein YpmB
MTYVALGELVIIIALLAGLREMVGLLNKQLNESREAEKKTKTELLSVLGKTETVALTFEDRRPSYEVSYVDDEKMVNLEKAIDRG